MSEVRIRPFRRADRDQVAALVNAHVAAVVPNVPVSVQALMSQLERDPGEFIVDPWVTERVTLVAEQRERVVAAAHLLRYANDERVSADFKDAGEIRWLLCWPEAPYWPDAKEAGDVLVTACLAQLQRWGVSRCYADGTLPAPAVYGVPEQWPHVRDIYHRAGFRADDSSVEDIYLAVVDEVPRPKAPLPGLTAVRTLGVNGTRFSAVLDGRTVGYIEVDTSLDTGSWMSRTAEWADVGNLRVEEGHRRRGIGGWLVGQAAEWLRLGGVTRLLDYASADDGDEFRAFLKRVGFGHLTRTIRGLTLE